MKKMLLFMLCLMLVCAMPLAVFADETVDVTTGEVVVDITDHGDLVSTEAVPPEETLPETLPAPETEAFKEQVEIEFATLTENIKVWIEENSALIGLIVTIIGYGLVMLKKLGTIVKSASTMNNNAIAIAKNSETAIGQALSSIENASGTVTNYDESISALLEAFKSTAEDKAKLEAELLEVKNYLKTSTDANLLFADEFCELLSLANIPNYKKEALGEAFVAAKKSILDTQAVTPTATEEVKEDVGEES